MKKRSRRTDLQVPSKKETGPSAQPSLRIAIDFPWDASACMGTGAYSETMVRALAKAASESRITLITSPGAKATIDLPNVRYTQLRPVDVRSEGPRQVSLPSLLLEIEADCLFAPATLLPLLKVCPMVAAVHDLTFIRHPEYYAPGLVDYLTRWFDPTLRVADRLVAVSEETRDELASLKGIHPDRVTVIRQPVRETFTRPLAEPEVAEKLRALGVTRPYFFHVSNLAPHKNVTFALEAFAKFLAESPQSPHLFVLAGGGYAPNRPPDLLGIAKSLGIEERVRYVGRVGDPELKALYQGCQAFLFPSLAEGWGLPVAEAASLGARVLASPHVPAALESQRIPLEAFSWARGLAAPRATPEPYPRIFFEEAGRALFKILCEVVESRQEGSKGRFAHPEDREGSEGGCGPASGDPPKGKLLLFRPPSEAKPERPAKEKASQTAERPPSCAERPEVAIRADWLSPSGFGQAARNLHAALKVAGLAPRAVPVPKDAIQDERLWREQIDSSGGESDLWIHQLPPDYFDLNLPGRHVSLFFWETDRLPESMPNGVSWAEALNRLDEVWVPSRFLVEVLARSGVSVPAHLCRVPVDTDLFSPGARRPPRVDLPQGFDPSWTVFLYVGTWDSRKRPDLLVRAFSRAFTASDRALLLLKSYATGEPVKDRMILNGWLSQSRSGTAHVRVIPEILSTEEMADLCRFATVFATASRGEGYCLPAVQSMSSGKPVVGVPWSALEDLVSVPVKHRVAPVPPEVKLPGYSPKQNWALVDEEDLAAQLAWVHAHRGDVARLGREARAWVQKNASFLAVGEFLKARIEHLVRRDRSNLVLEAKR